MSSFNVSLSDLEEIQREVTDEPGFALLAISHLGTLCVTEILTPHSRRRKFCGLLGTLMIEGEGYRACATVQLPRKGVLLNTLKHGLMTPTIRADLEIYNLPSVSLPPEQSLNP